MTRTICDLLDHAAAKRGDLGFVFIDEAGEETFAPYAALLERVRTIAGGFRELGQREGARVALAIDDPLAFVATFLGAAREGLVPMPLAPYSGLRTGDAFLRSLLPTLDAGAPSLVVADARTASLLGAHARASGETSSLPPTARPSLRVVEPTAVEGPSIDEPRAVDGGAPAFIQFTSGSTCAPRGVVLTHDAVCANLRAIESELRIEGGDVGVSWLPLHHDMGLVGMVLTALRTSTTLVLMPPMLFVKSPGRWLRAISRHRATVSFAPSSAYAMTARRVRDRELEGLDLSSWRVAGVGAEPIHVGDLEGFATRFAPCGFDRRAFAPSYGLAEHVVAAALGPVGRGVRVDTVRGNSLAEGDRAEPCDDDDPRAARIVACGRRLPHHELLIVDEGGSPLADRYVGRILVRGPSRMLGYHGLERDDAAWLETGDLGYLTDGDLFVCGRKKELIIRAGEKLHPRDLEWAATRLPYVRAAVAFGVVRDGTERIVLLVECVGATGAARADDIAAEVQGECGARVDEVRIVPTRSLPRTTSGKLQRVRVREIYLAELERGVAP
jgi:fatty-acyl-CoA synthase